MKTIIVVDDEKNISELVSQYLKFHGFRAFPFTSPKDALDFCLKEKRIVLDAIVTDYSMPEMNGLELISELKKNIPGMKAIVLSGYLDSEIDWSGFGLDRIFQKPILLREILQALQEILPENH